MTNEKPKRKHGARKPVVFLGAGILIGAVVAAVAIVTTLLVITPSAPVVATADAQVARPVSPTPDMNRSIAQRSTPRPTVIAPRIRSASIAPDGTHLAVARLQAGRTDIRIYDQYLEDSLLARDPDATQITLDALASDVTVDISPTNARVLITSRAQAFVAVYGLDGVQVATFDGRRAAAWSADGRYLVTADAEQLELRDARDLTLLATIRLDMTAQAVRISPDSAQIALIAGDTTSAALLLYSIPDIAAGANPSPTRITLADANTSDTAFHPSGRYLALAYPAYVQVIDLNDGDRRNYGFTRDYGDVMGTMDMIGRVRAVTFSTAGDWLIIGGGLTSNGRIGSIVMTRWDEGTIIPPDPNYFTIQTLGWHQHDVSDLRMTPAGYLLSASDDGSVRLWDIETQAQLSRVQL